MKQIIYYSTHNHPVNNRYVNIFSYRYDLLLKIWENDNNFIKQQQKLACELIIQCISIKITKCLYHIKIHFSNKRLNGRTYFI